jgi:hypothetical protein
MSGKDRCRLCPAIIPGVVPLQERNTHQQVLCFFVPGVFFIEMFGFMIGIIKVK